MSEKIKIDIPIVVEGKYDKIKVSSVVDGQIIVTDGFGVFASEEKAALVRRLAEPRGIIILTDSDGAGLVIRNYFNKILPKNKLYHLYIPQIEGKERRKKSPSKEGMLGVEGMEINLLRELFEPFASEGGIRTPDREITKNDFYRDGLSGGEASAAKRIRLCKYLSLPGNMSANALLAAINLLGEAQKYEEFILHDRED